MKNYKFQFFLCVLLLAGCQKSAPTPQQSAATEEAISGQYREELLAYAVDNLGRLEEFTSPDVLRSIIERLNPENQPKPDEFNPLLSSWPQPEMLYQVVDRLNQWARTQPPPSGWQRDPMLSELPGAVPRTAAVERPRLDGVLAIRRLCARRGRLAPRSLALGQG